MVWGINVGYFTSQGARSPAGVHTGTYTTLIKGSLGPGGRGFAKSLSKPGAMGLWGRGGNVPHHRQGKHQRKAGKKATFQEDAGDRLKNREVRRAHRGEAQRVRRRALDAGQDPACPGAGVRWSCKRPPSLQSPCKSWAML